MKINKAYKYRIYPNKTQKEFLDSQFGSCRFIYNYFLNQRQEHYLTHKDKIKAKELKSLNYYDNAGELTKLKKQFTWLKNSNSQTLQQSLRNLETAYSNFFRGHTKFPKYKSKHDKQSCIIPQFFSLKDNKLYIPKVKSGIKIIISREIVGELCSVTISKTKTGKYYASILTEQENICLSKKEVAIGLDLGIKDLITCSDGAKIENLKLLRKQTKKLSYLQRQLSKKKKGSNSRNKARLEVAKCHESISNCKKDYLHKTTTALIRENQTIVVEDLAVINMMKNHKLARAISECSWGEILRQLKYKSEWYGRNLIVINRFFPSSKMCSDCGYINQELTLKDREWVCPNCGTKHDRDINASINIKNSGLGINSEYKQKLVEALPVGKSMKQESPAFMQG
jgi:putative transposase